MEKVENYLLHWPRNATESYALPLRKSILVLAVEDTHAKPGQGGFV